MTYSSNTEMIYSYNIAIAQILKLITKMLHSIADAQML